MGAIKKSELDALVNRGNLPPKEIQHVLESYYYKSKKDWITFLKFLFLGLGSGLMCAGVIFFFAFNWDQLHKFFKLSLIVTLLCGSLFSVLFLKLKPIYSNVLLTVSAVLVGVAFSIYGQIYQTGADAFDFFLAWTCFVVLWAFSSRFSPLWVVFLTLSTITIGLYFDQMVTQSETDLLMCILIAKFTGIYFSIRCIEWIKKQPVFDQWFDHLLQITIVVLITGAAQISLFTSFKLVYTISIGIMASAFYGYLFSKGLKTKNILSISIIPFSIMWMVCVYLIHLSDDLPMIVFLIVITVVFMIVFVKQLLMLLKKWKNEKV